MIKCNENECVYNAKNNCECANTKITVDPNGAKCNSFLKEMNFKDDFKYEFAKDFCDSPRCSAENCVFNIHYVCRAGSVEIQKDSRECKTMCKI